MENKEDNNQKKETPKIKPAFDVRCLPPAEQMKYEIAMELGLYDQVLEKGWKSLSAKDTGRIGGLITKKKQEQKKAKLDSNNSIDPRFL